MKIQRFEDLICWQKAQDLAVLVYKLFGESGDNAFRNQVCRASVSVSNNIAEGYTRNSKREFIRFLNIARASCEEVKSMTYLASRLAFLREEEKTEVIQHCEEVSRTIYGLIKSIDKTINKKSPPTS